MKDIPIDSAIYLLSQVRDWRDDLFFNKEIEMEKKEGKYEIL